MSDPGPNIPLGTRVRASGNLGYVRYVGHTSFSTGHWVGIELDLPKGKNDGSVEGTQYFECKDKHGVFVRPTIVHIVNETPQPEASRQPVATSRTGTATRTGATSRPSSVRTSVSSTTASASGTRTSRPPPGRRIGGTDSTPESPVSTRRVRGSPQLSRDEDSHQFRSATPPTPNSQQSQQSQPQLQQQQLQQQLLLQQLQQQQQQQHHLESREDSPSIDDDAETLLAQEQQIMEEIEQEEALARKQQQLDQQGFAPPSTPATIAALSNVASAANTRQEASVPLKELEELKIKLRILESKRTEDREKLRDAEKIREESEQFLSIRTKLQAKLTDMQQELRESKRALKEAVAEKEAFESKYNDVVDSMEVTMIDKEMAEERAENLQHEVNILKEKVDEMHVDLNVFQQDEAGATNPALNQVQLEKQNERLKDALIKLRDMTSEQEAEMTRKLKNLEKEASLVQEVQIQNEKLRESLDVAENQIEELKQRLDDAIGAEDMIEQLSEKNIALGEKIEEMQSAIDDLEALKELNDELEENHNENEKQLQVEINAKDSQLRDQQRKIETMEENIADYENTILQFRELVAHLQSDLDQLRQKEESKGGLGQSQAMLSLNLQLQSTAMKAQAKAIDLELRKLDALQANDNLMLVQPYLPDGFFRTENDSIQCLLLFKRLAFKSDLMSKHLEQQYGVSDKIAQNAVSSELAPVCEVRQKLTWFGDMAKQFVSFIEGCPVDVFGKMGEVYHDLVGTERRLNTWVELLRKEELKESDCIVDLQRAISQLDHLADTYLGGTKLDLAERFAGAAHALDLNFDRVYVNLTTIGLMFKSNEDGVRLVDSDDVQYQLVQSVTSMGAQAKSGKAATRKLLRKLDEFASQSSTVKSEFYSQYKNACATSTKLGEFTHEAKNRIALYVAARREGSKTDSIHQTIYNVTDTCLGVSETGMWDGCRKMLNGLLQDVTAIVESILGSDISTKVTKPDKVWMKRAKDMKAEVTVNVEAEQKVLSLQEQLVKLVKEAKLKEQALQESHVNIELLTNRMETLKKQAEQFTILDRDANEARKQKRDYDEAISALQADMAALEEQNSQLRRLIPKKPDINRIVTPSLPDRRTHGYSNSVYNQESTGSAIAENADASPNRDVLLQLESLKSALRFLRSENASLRTRTAMLDLGLTPDMSSLTEPLSRRTGGEESDLQSEASQKRSALVDTELKAVALETRRLIKDARVICASPKIVDLTKHTTSKAHSVATPSADSTNNNRRHWQAQQTRPEWQYHTQQAALHTIQKRSDELKERLAKVSRSTNHPAPTKFKKLSLVDSPIGRVHLPLGMSSLVGSPERQQVSTRKDLSVFLKSAAEFEAMHQLFVR